MARDGIFAYFKISGGLSTFEPATRFVPQPRLGFEGFRVSIQLRAGRGGGEGWFLATNPTPKGEKPKGSQSSCTFGTSGSLVEYH